MNKNESINNNFDDANIAFLRKKIKEDKINAKGKKAYTMLQTNSSCNVKITDSSRKKCARMLIK